MSDLKIRWGVRPSNGTDGEYQREDTCYHCVKDHDWHGDADGTADSCPIILDSLAGEHSYPNPEGPPQWGRDEATGTYVCREYEGPCSCGDRRADRFRAITEAVS